MEAIFAPYKNFHVQLAAFNEPAEQAKA